MASRAELLSRGQASRNRQWAGRGARAQVAAILFLICAGVGGYLGWQTAPERTQQWSAIYLEIQIEDLKNPFARNLRTPEAQAAVARRDALLSDESPATREFNALLWRMGFFAVLTGLAIGLPLYWWRRREWLKEGERAGRDRTVRGTELVSAEALAKQVKVDPASKPVTIGGVAIPPREEARHFLIAGATGTGKTTAIFAMLDRVEARGEHAFVHDVDGSYVARYYRPERGDIILNPFDARCAYWNPFVDIGSPADADRLAAAIVSKPKGGASGDDVWYDQARIVAAVVIRRLWEQGRGTIAALEHALGTMTAEELRAFTKGTEAARVFQEDAERATNSVLFCLADASKVMKRLNTEQGDREPFSFDRFYQGLPERDGAKPWIFLASRKRSIEAARPLLGCWLECAVAAILDRPTQDAPRAWLILDELANLPRAQGLLTLLPEGRKYEAACVIAFQAIGQLRETYGNNGAGTIVGQSSTQLVMRLGDPDSASWASQLLGRSEVEEHRASASLDTDEVSDRGSLSSIRQTKPVVLDSEIGQLPPLTGFLRLSGMPIARVQITRGHMNRPAIAEATVPLAATQVESPPSANATRPDGGLLDRPPDDPASNTSNDRPNDSRDDPGHDRTAGGAL